MNSLPISPQEVRFVRTVRSTAPYGQKPAAFLISGESSVDWLKELSCWGIPLRGLRLYPVPRSVTDRRPMGVLVTGSETDLEKADSGKFCLISPYRCIGTNLFLASDGDCLPVIGDEEWETLLPEGYSAFLWNPVCGLIAFEAGDERRVVDLLNLPVQHVNFADFQAALPGARLNERLVSLQVLVFPTADQVLGTGRDNIGSESDEMRRLLERPTAADLLQNLGRLLLMPFRLISWLLGAIGSAIEGLFRWLTGGRDTRPVKVFAPRLPTLSWFSQVFLTLIGLVLAIIALPFLIIAWLIARLLGFAISIFPMPLPSNPPPGGMNWQWPEWFSSWLSKLASPLRGIGKAAGAPFQRAAQILNSASELTSSILNARQHALNKLMKMLEENPDEGLKYALPFGGDLGRGQAAPGSSLGRRDVNFKLGGFGGSGPADVWQVPPDQQLYLLKRYRELAQREMNLGRYRRAAYIYAELLGDLSSAAGALKTGRFYREAAVLYRDKLNNRRAAAECLEQGGLLDEAIPLFRELGEIEKVGDLYSQLDRIAEAREAYEEAVEIYLNRGSRLRAATLAEVKLKDQERALDILEQGWPQSGEAQRCLEEYLRMLGKLKRHDRTRSKLTSLVEDTTNPYRQATLTRILGGVALDYPNDEVRHQAADATRIVASKYLLNPSGEHGQVLSTLAGLDVTDKLLERDCQRFGRTASKPIAQQLQRSLAHKLKRRTVIASKESYVLPAWPTTISAAATWDGFYLLRVEKTKMCVSRHSWQKLREPSREKRDENGRLPLPHSTWVEWGIGPEKAGQEMTGMIDIHQGPHIEKIHVTASRVSSRLEMRRLDREDVYSREAEVWPLNSSHDFPHWAFVTDDRGWLWTYSVLDGLQYTDTNRVMYSLQESFDEQPSAEYDPVFAKGGNGLYLAHGEQLMEIDLRMGKPAVATHKFYAPVHAISATEPGRRVRVAVGFEDHVDLYWDHLGTRARRVAEGFQRPQSTFLPTGQLIVVTSGRGVVIDVSQGSPQHLCEFTLPNELPLGVFPMQAHGFLIVYRSGILEVFHLRD